MLVLTITLLVRRPSARLQHGSVPHSSVARGRKQTAEELQQFDHAAEELATHGGGVISTYYHPTEFVHENFGMQ